MEAFKLAFETVIIGLFALPWLWVMVDLMNPDLCNSSGVSRLISLIPSELKASVIGLSLFALVYLLGSMITPVACEFLNDKDMLGGVLPTEEKIQAWAYKQVRPGEAPGMLAKFEPVSLQDRNDERFREAAHKEFQREESAILLHGTDNNERINKLHEQLTVLRGATFSAFALMVLCGFAWCGRIGNDQTRPESPWQRAGRSVTFTMASALILVAGTELIRDVHKLEEGDMPIAEIVLIILGGLGLYVSIFGTRSRFHFHGATFVFALCLALLCYAGYGCVANSYDQAVFSAYQALPAEAGGGSHAAAARGLLTAVQE